MSAAVETPRVADNVYWTLRHPDGTSEWGSVHNLVTQVGDQCLAERGFGLGSLAAPVGMKLGTGSTAVAKTGAGAALVTYLTGSNKTFDTTPTSTLSSSTRRITATCTYAAGVATSASPITEAVLFLDANANSTSTAANTFARAIIAPGAKGALDVLTVVWQVDVLGT